MSEFHVEVVRVGPITKHPSADRLGITMVHASPEGVGGYPVVLNTSDKDALKEGDLAVYLPVDSMVPASDPRFSFLVPPPERKEDMTDLEWQTRLARYERERQTQVRIRAHRFRGIFSMGLLIPVTMQPREGDVFGRLAAFDHNLGLRVVQVGDDVADILGVTKYEPDEANKRRPSGSTGFADSGVESCPLPVPVYTDIESLWRYESCLVEGEEVVITEKVHGQNMRVVHDGQRLYVGSHYQWKRPPHDVTKEERNAWRRRLALWKLLHPLFVVGYFVQDKLNAFVDLLLSRFTGAEAPALSFMPKEKPKPRQPRDVPMSNWWDAAFREGLEMKLAGMPGLVVYGEVYGPCQDLMYGTEKLRFRAFDAYETSPTGKGPSFYLSYDTFKSLMDTLGIETMPVLYRGPWSPELKKLAEGKTVVGNGAHVREGFVVRPAQERFDPRVGRVILKRVGEGYHLR